MKVKKYKPGTGWFTYPLCPVSEHKSGVRVHEFGIAGLISEAPTIIPDNELSKYRRICGGNKKRAVMVWAKVNLIEGIS